MHLCLTAGRHLVRQFEEHPSARVECPMPGRIVHSLDHASCSSQLITDAKFVWCHGHFVEPCDRLAEHSEGVEDPLRGLPLRLCFELARGLVANDNETHDALPQYWPNTLASDQ